MVSPEMAYLETAWNYEMALGGVTTMVDMYLFEENATEANKGSWIEGIIQFTEYNKISNCRWKS